MKLQGSNGESITVPKGMEEDAFEAQANNKLAEFADSLKKREEARKEAKKGGLIKRKDGSYSRRGLWDNIRANRGSGRKPTKEMLKQEAKIRAKQAAGGTVFKGYVTDWTPGDAVPWHYSTIGESETMGKGGYTVKRSSARKGKTHVVIGPDGTKKYFGDSKLGQHPKDPKRKKAFYARHAKNLKGNPYFRAFARATWADGGKLTDNMYDLGIVPYDFGGPVHHNPSVYGISPSHSIAMRVGYETDLNPDGTIHVPYGFGTPAYNERMGLGGLFGKVKEGVGNFFERNKPGELAADTGRFLLDTTLSTAGSVTGVQALKDVVKDRNYHTAAFDKASNVAGGIGDITDTALNFIPGVNVIAGGVGAVGGLANKSFGIDKKFADPREHQSQFEKIAGGVKQVGDIAGMIYNPGAAAGSLGNVANIFGKVGQGAGLANMAVGAAQGEGFNPLQALMMANGVSGGNLLGGGSGYGVHSKHGGYVHMAEGGETGLVPINVEGADFSEGSGPDAKKGELLVLNGKVIKNYVGRPPHPAEGQDPLGNDDAPEGLIVIPKARTKEYLEASLEKRKQIERSLVSQQQDREMRKSNKMEKGGTYSRKKSGDAARWNAYNDPYTVIAMPDRSSSFAEDSIRVFPGQRSFGKTPYMKDLGNQMGVITTEWNPYYQLPEGARMYQDSTYMYANPEFLPRRKKGDGGYYSFGMGDQGMAYGGPIGNPETINDITYGTMKKGGWIQKATASIKRRGTEGVCTGSKFGSSSCPPGSRRYNLAKTFRAMAKRRKHEDGGFIDPVTGSHTVMYKEGGPTIHDFPIRRLKYLTGAEITDLTPADNSFDYYGDGYPSIFGNQTPPEMDPAQLNQGTPVFNPAIVNFSARTGQPSSGMSIARANRSPYSIGALRGIPEGTASERYMQGVDQDLRKTLPDLYSSSKYGTSSMSNPSSSSDYNYANMMQDTASMLPALYNLGRGAFEKPVKMNYLDYTTPEMQFRKTKFDPTPYDYASSRAQYALRQAGAGPGYKAGVGNIAAQVAQARSSGYMDWMNKEALRRQGVDEANLGIAARNKAMQLQIAMLNQQAKANRNKYFETATEQFAQEFGRNPMYFKALAGQAPRQPFTGWKKP